MHCTCYHSLSRCLNLLNFNRTSLPSCFVQLNNSSIRRSRGCRSPAQLGIPAEILSTQTRFLTRHWEQIVSHRPNSHRFPHQYSPLIYPSSFSVSIQSYSIACSLARPPQPSSPCILLCSREKVLSSPRFPSWLGVAKKAYRFLDQTTDAPSPFSKRKFYRQVYVLLCKRCPRRPFQVRRLFRRSFESYQFLKKAKPPEDDQLFQKFLFLFLWMYLEIGQLLCCCWLSFYEDTSFSLLPRILPAQGIATLPTWNAGSSDNVTPNVIKAQ